jgi:hypothetical protein
MVLEPGFSFHRDPIEERGGVLLCGDSYRQMKEGAENGASLWEVCQLNVEKGLFLLVKLQGI